MSPDTVLDNFPLVDRGEYRRTGHYETDFLTGTKPAWITEITSAATTITYSSNRGGYAQINTGMTAAGDNGTLRFTPKVVPSNYDLVIIRVDIEGEHNSALVQNRTQLFGSGAGNTMQAMRDYDYLNISGTNEELPDKNWSDGPIEQYVVWDLENDRAWSVVGGLCSTLRNGIPIDPTVEYNVNFLYFQTNDITADRICRLFGAELSLYER